MFCDKPAAVFPTRVGFQHTIGAAASGRPAPADRTTANPFAGLERETDLPVCAHQNAAFVAFATRAARREFRDLHRNIINLNPHRLLAPVLLEQA